MSAVLQFTIEGLAPDALRAFAVDGTEALSTLYSFDIDCLGRNGRAMEPLALVGKRASLRIELDGAQPREVHGIIDRMEVEPPSIFGDARYRFRLVPWLARLELSRSNQIHGTANPVSVADVIEAELSGALRPTAEVSDSDMRRFEHELRLRDRGAYPKRDHVSQYEETDFAFISRLAEHAGIFYFFENDGPREKVVFADDNLFATPLEGGARLDWKPWSSGGREAAPDTIQALRQASRRVPQKLWLQDHNYRLPHVPLLVEAEVDSRGRGNWVEYGAHHRTPEEGTALARIRAEELRCQQSRWHGSSAVARLAPGRVIRLAGHPYDSWNQDYLVVSVRHEVRVPMPGVAEFDWAGYRNSFEMIDREVPFRPARVTPVPRMDGLLNGRVDGAGDRSRAEIDDQGRYKVRVPFDLGGSPDGKASQWIRMSSPFGGDGDGMHFPLFPDTEVVIGCVNGDPDRPVILGAVPNPRNRAVVTSNNSRQNRLVTRSGLGFEMSDDGGGSGGGGGGGGGVNAYGAGPPRTPDAALPAPDALGAVARPVTGAAEASVLAAPDALSSSIETGDISNYGRLFVQGGTAGALTAIEHMTRLGAVPAATGTIPEPAEVTNPGALGYLKTKGTAPVARTDTPFNAQPGSYDFTTGQRYIAVHGNMGVKVNNDIIMRAGADGTGDLDISSGAETRITATGPIQIYSAGEINIEAVGDVNVKTKAKATKTVDGQSYEHITSDSFKWVDANSTTITYGNSMSATFGIRNNQTYGSQNDLFVGLRTSLNILGAIQVNLAIALNVFIGASFSFNLSYRFTLNTFGSHTFTWMFSTSTFYGGRITNITGLEVKKVTGIDVKLTTGDVAKRQLFNINLDTVEAKANNSLQAVKDNLTASNASLVAQAVSAVKLVT